MKKSVYKFFTSSFIILYILLFFVAFCYGLYSILQLEKAYMNRMSLLLDTYVDNFQDNLNRMFQDNQKILADNKEFQILSLPDCTDTQRVEAEYHFRQIMIADVSDWGILVLFDALHNRRSYCFGPQLTQISQEEKMLYIDEVEQFFKNNVNMPANKWFYHTFAGRNTLSMFSHSRNLYYITIMDIDCYAEQNQISEYIPSGKEIFFRGNNVVINEEYLKEKEIQISDIQQSEENLFSSFVRGFLNCTVYLSSGEIGISVLIPVSVVLKEVLPQSCFFFLVLILFSFFVIVIYRLLSKVLVFPMKEIEAISNHLEEPSTIEQSNGSLEYEEFENIRASILNLLKQRTRLEEEKKKKELAEEHAILQYYQLQTRSHFFLNCLKSLYHLSEQEDVGKMQMMIASFSDHLRYVFQDTLSFVSLEMELREVSDYYKIISADHLDRLILSIDVPDKLRKCPVPTLCIQVFLENTLKYGNSSGKILNFSVKASITEDCGKKYLHIRIKDNGKGYSTEVLEMINRNLVGTFDKYNVGINNLRRRMNILYNGRSHAVFYNAPGGGAVSVLYFPLEGNNDTIDCR